MTGLLRALLALLLGCALARVAAVAIDAAEVAAEARVHRLLDAIEDAR